ncbi:unnamed protein product [Cochlearia groenlandica]
MNSATVLDGEGSLFLQVPVLKDKGKKTVLESLMSSAQRRKLADITNLQVHSKQLKLQETLHQQQNMLFSAKEHADKLLKENLSLHKALAHRNKIIEVSGFEFQKLKINLRIVQEKNLQLAQANSHMLAELNANKDRLKLLQHELGCKNVLLKTRKKQLEEQELPGTQHTMKDKLPENVSDGDFKLFQGHDMYHKAIKRKRTPRIKPSGSSNVKPIEIKENANSKREVSGVINTTGIPEQTCQAEGDNEKEVIFRGENQINIEEKFVLDAAKPVKESVHNKRQCVQRRSSRFSLRESEQTEKLHEMNVVKETTRFDSPSLRRQSARLRPDEAEPCKSFHERDEANETIKRRRFSSRRQSARFDFQEPEVTETLKADAGSLVREETIASISEVVEPSESRHDTKETNVKRRVSTRRQSTKVLSHTATETVETIKEITTNPSVRNNIVQECDQIPSSVSQEDNETELKKKKPKKDNETEETMRRTSVGRPSRHAAEKIQSYREVSLRVKMRRN